jgi:hypothetical protein
MSFVELAIGDGVHEYDRRHPERIERGLIEEFPRLSAPSPRTVGFEFAADSVPYDPMPFIELAIGDGITEYHRLHPELIPIAPIEKSSRPTGRARPHVTFTFADDPVPPPSIPVPTPSNPVPPPSDPISFIELAIGDGVSEYDRRHPEPIEPALIEEFPRCSASSPSTVDVEPAADRVLDDPMPFIALAIADGINESDLRNPEPIATALIEESPAYSAPSPPPVDIEPAQESVPYDPMPFIELAIRDGINKYWRHQSRLGPLFAPPPPPDDSPLEPFPRYERWSKAFP